jgi:predicted TIM-barrel fold metal-dependent hydrolase
MNPKGLSLLIWIVSIAQCFGQGNMNKLPVIDMHLHVYSNENYWGGSDFSSFLPFSNTVLTSPKTNNGHIKAVLDQMSKNNIVLAYASGNFEALDSLNIKYPGKFFPLIGIRPTPELLSDNKYLETLKQKIVKGEIKGIGEVLNFYNGIAPNNPIMDTLYKIAVSYDLPVGIHFGLAPPGSQLSNFPDMRIEFGNPLMIQDVLIKFPKLRLNIMHAALPLFGDETLAIMYMFPNVYADIGVVTWADNYTIESVKEFLIKASKYGLTDRIMYGSDEMVWPGSIGLSVDFIKNVGFLTDKQKNDILYNNAAKFLRLLHKPVALTTFRRQN